MPAPRDAFAVAYAQGRAMTLEQAIEYALAETHAEGWFSFNFCYRLTPR